MFRKLDQVALLKRYWGVATDEKRVYTNISNSDFKNFTLKPSIKNTTAGGWVVTEAHNGKIPRPTANPSNATVSVANGVVFGGSTHIKGPIYALSAKAGDVLWLYETGATVYSGMSVSDRWLCFYWEWI